MRLISITVRNYRIHRERTVELDPYRNLIGGPNESGKSTLVEAVHRGLFLKAKGNTEFHRAMVSTVHSGHPEVELRFEAGTLVYHLKKRFGSTGTIILTPPNSAPLSGEAAEAELAKLLGLDATASGKAAANQWQHLWVWQGESGRDPTDHANQHQSSLIQRLQQSGGAAAMQSDFDQRAAAHFSKLQESIFTQVGKPKVGSELERAEAAANEAESRKIAASERLERTIQAVRDFEESSSVITDSAGSIRKLDEQKTVNAAKLTRVEELRRSEIEQSNAAKSAAGIYNDFAGIHAKIGELRKEVARLEQALMPQRSVEIGLVEARLGAQQGFEEANQACELAMSGNRAARLQRDLAVAWVVQFEKAARLNELVAKTAQVAKWESELARHRLALAKLPAIDATKLKGLQRLENEVSNTQTALQAMAASFDLIAGVDTCTIDGKPLAVGESRLLTEEAEIATGSGLRFRIRPGGGNSLGAARKKAADARLEYQKSLDALGVQSLDEASTIAANRAELEVKMGLASSNLLALDATSLGTQLAEAETDSVTAEAEVIRRSGLMPGINAPESIAAARQVASDAEKHLEVAESEEARLTAIRASATKSLAKANEALAGHHQSIEAQNLTLAGHQNRLKLLVENHGVDEAREESLRELLAKKAAAEAVLVATQAELAALQPDFLISDRTRLDRALEQIRQARTDAVARQAIAQNTLQSDGSVDPDEAFALAASAAESAQLHLTSVRRKAEAIQLLSHLFQEEQRSLADQFTKPLVEKISGYLQCIFGAGAHARITLDGNSFAGLQLVRADQGGAVPFDALSGGAQQQVAAAVRLAMAEVLSANFDGCLPIVFDDAFAFSDSERVENLQRMLDLAASRGLQVIVLSCTPTDYGALGARSMVLRREKMMPVPPSVPVHPAADRDLVLAPLPAFEVTSEQRERLLNLLRESGGKAGNQKLREIAGWDESLYEAVKNNLVATRHIVVGPGRGGSIALPEYGLN